MKPRLPHLLASLWLALALAVPLVLAPMPASADDACTIDSFGEAVDDSAEALRTFSAETQPRLKQKLQQLREHKGWAETDYEAKGLTLVHDDRLDAFDAQAAELLGRIDTLGTPDAGNAESATCEKLDELKTSASELMAVMRAKSDHLISNIDREIAASPKAEQPAVGIAATEPAKPAPPRLPVAANDPPPAAAAQQPDLSPIRRTETPRELPKFGDVTENEIPADETPAHPPSTRAPATQPLPKMAQPTPSPDAAPEHHVAPEHRAAPPADIPPGHVPPDLELDDATSWSTTTAQAVVPPPRMHPAPPRGSPGPDAYDHQDLPPGYGAPQPGDPPGVPYTLPDEDAYQGPHAGEDGYTIDEIREATRGFFGTVSTSLASVIEHAFQQSGRPTAYVLGQEGGAAFLAGLRYGQGTLYLRNGGQQQVYWHGPSLGYDIGGDGSRTLFLIYSLDQPENLFRRFTGVDGSAYLVGGVGMTLLKGGPVTMAPIRSGIGLRLGASIGYVRFTPRPTWNPF